MAQITPLPKVAAFLVRSLLRDRTVRERERLFVLEGEKTVREVLQAPAAKIHLIVLTPVFLERADQKLLKMLTTLPAPVHLCPEPLFSRLSDVQTAQGLLAVIAKPVWDEPRVLSRRQIFAVYGEHLQDPTNLGTLIRTAAAFGVDAVWLSLDSVDPFNPKVARASAGALLTLPVFTVRDPARLVEAGCTLLASEAVGRRGQDLRTITRRPARMILALGNESRGLSEATLRRAAVRLHVATSQKVESLNVATAAAICLFQLSGVPVERAPG